MKMHLDALPLDGIAKAEDVFSVGDHVEGMHHGEVHRGKVIGHDGGVHVRTKCETCGHDHIWRADEVRHAVAQPSAGSEKIAKVDEEKIADPFPLEPLMKVDGAPARKAHGLSVGAKIRHRLDGQVFTVAKVHDNGAIDYRGDSSGGYCAGDFVTNCFDVL